MPSLLALLPAINKNLSQVIDQNDFGLVAYGARSDLYTLDLRTSPPTIFDQRVILNAHRGKVISISFSKGIEYQFLASIGEDKVLKIWDQTNTSLLGSLEVKENSRTVEWIYGSVDCVAFSDGNGYISKWNFRTAKVTRIKTNTDVPTTVLASNPKCPDILAVGHTTGAISVVNVVNHVLMRKLRSHTNVITSLSWSPVSSNILLSTSLDLSARLWNLGEENPKTFFYPSSRNKMEDKRNVKICGLCHPENPDVIFCSNVRGELGSVTFKDDKPAKFKPFTGENVYNDYKHVVAMLPYFDKDKKRHMFLSCDHLKVSIWDVSEQKSICSLQFTFGIIFDLSLSTHHPDLMAICSGDGTLKVWKQNSEDKLLDMTSIYIHHRIKIMTAVWHPTEEYILAYGVDEGRVGIADIHKKKSLYSFETHHNGTVYSLEWGPCAKHPGSNSDFYLYSCGGGTVYINQLNKPKDQAINFSTIVQLPPDTETNQSSELSWNYDYSYFAIGSFKGYIDLFNGKLDFLTRIVTQIKNIESLKWHPMCTLSSPNGSPYKSWIAACGNDENIHIIDTSDLSGFSESGLCKSIKKLVGHKKRVSSVCWSQHNDGFLVSAARDGTVQVWNVCSNTPVANYSWHKDLVYTACWSVSDPDVIFSGGRDSCLRIWKISQQIETCPPSKTFIKKVKPLKPKVNKTETAVNEVKAVEESEPSSSKNTVSLDVQQDEDIPISDALSDQSKTKDTFKKGMNLNSVILPKYSKEEGLENVCKLVDYLCDKPEEGADSDIKLSSEEILKLSIFSNQDTVLDFLEAKAKTENENGSISKSWYLNLMTGNIKQMIIEAAERKELSEFLVAISPSVSVLFWHDVCEKYAIQLIEDAQYVKASVYFMLCGKLYDGLKLLSEKGKILEALTFAKARLPESDPMLTHLLYKTAKFFSHHHQIELEASCYLALKDPLQAARVLFCTADLKSIYAAVYICHKFQLKDDAEAYAYFCMEKCLTQNDWPTFYKIIELIGSFKVYTSLIRVHEIITSHTKTLKKEEGLLSKNIFGIDKSTTLIWSGKNCENTNQSLISQLYTILTAEGIVKPEVKEDLKSIQNALYDLEQKRNNFDVSAEAHISVAIWATQTVVSLLLNEIEVSMKYFNKIFISAHNVVFLSRVMFWLFLPLNVYYSCDTESFDSNIKELVQTPIEYQLQHVYKLVCSKFLLVNTFSTSKLDITVNLDSTVSKAVEFLSQGKTGDSIVLYFFDSYLQELRRLTKKGWKFRCYRDTSNCVKNIIKADEIGVITEIKNNVIEFEANDEVPYVEEEMTENYANNLPKDLSDVDSRENNVQELINSVLKEAEEKAQEIIESEKIILGQSFNSVNRSITDSDNKYESVNTNPVDPAFQNMGDKINHADNLDDKGYDLPKDLSDVDSRENNVQELINSALKEAEEKAQEIIESEKIILGQSFNSVNRSITDSDNKYESVNTNPVDPAFQNMGDKINHADNLDDKGYDLPKDLSDVDSTENNVQELINSALKEAEEKAQEIIESEKIILGQSFNSDNKYESVNTNPVDPAFQNMEDKINHADNLDDKGLSESNCLKSEHSYSINSDHHSQCWYDMNLCYDLTKHFSSALCREEYALLYYFENVLNNLDTLIAKLAKKTQLMTQISVKQSDGKPNDNEKKVLNSNDVSPQDNKQMVNLEISSDDKVDIKLMEVKDSTLSEENLKEIKLGANKTSELFNSGNCIKVSGDSETMLQYSETNSNGATDASNSMSILNSNRNKSEQNEFLAVEGNIKILPSENYTCKTEISASSKEEIIEPFVSSSNEIDTIEFHGKTYTAAELLHEHKKISEYLKSLKELEFSYPNPVVAASTVINICYDVFHKHPCKVVQEKFHELSHQILKWKNMFLIGDKPLECDICKKVNMCI